MEQNLPIVTKKLWNMVRLAFFMLRKGICKNKILLDLNLMMKKAMITGKASATRRGGITSHLQHATSDYPREYEFSCNDTPLYRHFFTNKRKIHDHQMHDHYMMISSPSLEDTSYNLEAINQVLETMLSSKNRGPRQLRITDSPSPLDDEDDIKCDQHVDEAAEEFIQEFYSQLKEQKC